MKATVNLACSPFLGPAIMEIYPCVCSVGEGSSGSSSIGTYLSQVAENSAGVREPLRAVRTFQYWTPPSRGRPTLGLVVTLSNSSGHQEFVTHLAVKRLRVPVLPGAARHHRERPRARRLQVPRTASAANSGSWSLRRRCGGAPPLATTSERISWISAAVMPRRGCKRKAFKCVLIDQAQPLRAPTVVRTVKDEVPCPSIFLASRRTEVAAGPVLAVRASRLGGGGPAKLQPRLPPEAVDGLLVDRPPLATQQHPDPSVAVPQLHTDQFLNPEGQREPLVAMHGGVAQAGSSPCQGTTGAAVWNVEDIR